MTATPALLIWWTSQAECEQIGDALSESVPDYIRSEYRSRLGRNGRGRLWVASRIALDEIPWDATKPAARLASDRAGIVVDATDVEHVFGLPGFLTDTSLNFVNVWPDAALCEQIAALTAERDAALSALDEQSNRLVACLVERDDLRRQLAAAQTWQPVEPGEDVFVDANDVTCIVDRQGDALTLELWDRRNRSSKNWTLPPDLRLCRQLADSRLWCTMCGDQLDATSVCGTCYDLRPCEACDDMARQLAAAQEWQPVGAADPDIVCEHGTLVQAHGTSIAIGQQVTPDSDELVWTVAELPAGYALCTRQEPTP